MYVLSYNSFELQNLAYLNENSSRMDDPLESLCVEFLLLTGSLRVTSLVTVI